MLRGELPNLELLVYKAERAFFATEECKEKFKEYKSKSRYAVPDFEVEVFRQLWGNTVTGIDEDSSGNPVMAGQAFTGAYTTVVHEVNTDCYFVFFGHREAYVIYESNQKFYEDLKAKNLASTSRAKQLY